MVCTESGYAKGSEVSRHDNTCRWKGENEETDLDVESK